MNKSKHKLQQVKIGEYAVVK